MVNLYPLLKAAAEAHGLRPGSISGSIHKRTCFHCARWAFWRDLEEPVREAFLRTGGRMVVSGRDAGETSAVRNKPVELYDIATGEARERFPNIAAMVDRFHTCKATIHKHIADHRPFHNWS